MAREWKPEVRVWDSKAKQHVTIKLEVGIDWNAIAQQLGNQAMKNKSGRSAMLHGGIKAKIIGR